MNHKYQGRYIEVHKQYDYIEGCWMYKVGKSYKEIHENTTLGEDVGTDMEYRR